MNFSRNTNMVATAVATVLCGCPGLAGLCFGTAALFASFAPTTGITVPGNADPVALAGWEVALVCLGSLIAIAMPVIIWFATRRKGTISSIEREMENENVPPASN